MPKKLGLNSKAVEARARKEGKKREEEERVERQKEDELWKDEDKHVLRKMTRKEEKEKKKTDVLERKAANKAAYEEEMGPDGQRRGPGVGLDGGRVTRSQISANIEKEHLLQQQVLEKDKRILVEPMVIEENINRVDMEGDVASNIDEAISVLSVKEAELERHPERRLKAAYAAFEEQNLPLLKQENPNLRLSQLKQILKKDWLKSPANPLNQMHANYNTRD